MNLKEKLEDLIRKLPGVKLKAAALKITIKTGDDVEDYESMTLEELDALLEDLEDRLSTLQNNEPDDEESEEYEEWEDAISELEDFIEGVQDEIDSREE